MSTLWTPSGEHRPSDSTPSTPTPPDGRGAPDGAGEDLSPEEQAELAAELRRMRAELAATPVVDIVANHAVGIWQLAVLHLTPDPETGAGPEPHQLDEARTAIDA